MNIISLRHIVILASAAGLVASGWYAHKWYHHKTHNYNHHIVKKSGFRFTSPLLDIRFPEGVGINNDPLSFKYKLNEFVQKRTDGVAVQKISVYYRDLLDGPWIGINEYQEFNPASMMKVPVMIAWLKRAETRPTELKRTYIFDGKKDMTNLQSIKPAQTISPGKPYTVEELLHYMLRYSDNNAAALLYFNLKAEELNEVLDSMDVNNIPDTENNSISVTGYSGFFRILYNATYLNRTMSEKALELLSFEDFPQGFAAGVPKSTLMATKFGESEPQEAGAGKQLHEFGIVYHPKGHYILGVMTQGNDFTRQAAVIRDISSMVYSEVNLSATRR
ncbi:MAG TPA: serine hydrolase [Desulfuromonadales bacterium]|nr:serine hydrolase [Desulfuromonadales bacterium]